jgi:amidase
MVEHGNGASTSSWVGATAKQIARAVRRGDATATEVVADHIQHAPVADKVLSAMRMFRDAEAIAEAEKVDEQPDLADLPLAGVPVLVKENTPVAGLPTWHGSEAARTSPAEADHQVVKRLRGAGAVILGTSRMPELGLWGTTDDETAVTRNPWRTDRTPGGSSGGAAAAVASGLVPIAHGNDGLGSLRIPAACCGLVGFKPGRGVISYGVGVTDWFGLAEHGLLGTTVADVAVGFSVLAARTPAPLVQPGRLRIAVSTRSPVTGVSPDADTREAVANAARLLVGIGHDTVKADPVYPTKLGLAVIATWCGITRREVEGLELSRLQPRTRRHAAFGTMAWKRGWVKESDRSDFRTRSEAWFSDGGYDLMLLPTLAGPPPRAERWSAKSWRGNMWANLRYAPYTGAWNVAGFPAIAVPMGVRGDGLPGSVQLVGPPGSELLVLAVAAQLELAAPWRPHAPSWPRVDVGHDREPDVEVNGPASG